MINDNTKELRCSITFKVGVSTALYIPMMHNHNVIKDGVLELVQSPTQDQVVDVLTKYSTSKYKLVTECHSI